jgi:hypothetical protein
MGHPMNQANTRGPTFRSLNTHEARGFEAAKSPRLPVLVDPELSEKARRKPDHVLACQLRSVMHQKQDCERLARHPGRDAEVIQGDRSGQEPALAPLEKPEQVSCRDRRLL